MSLKDEIINVVKSSVRSVRDYPNLYTLTLDDLGLDSLDRIEIWVALEKRFKVEIPEEMIIKWNTFDDIEAGLREKGVRDEPEKELQGLPVF